MKKIVHNGILCPESLSLVIFCRRKHDSMTPHNLFSLITERLLLNCSQLTMPTYNVLFEVSISVECFC